MAFTLWLRKTSARRPSDQVYVTSHSHQMGSLPPNDVGRIAQLAREGEGRQEGKDGEGINLYL